MELKDLKKGDKVIMKSFTKTDLGVFEIVEAKEKAITIIKKSGDKAVFSRKTGKQMNMAEGKEKYANTIIPDDGSYSPMRKDPKKAAPKKTDKKKPAKKVVEEVEDEFDEEIEEEVEEAPKKKTSKKKVAKKVEEIEGEDEFAEEEEEIEEEDEFAEEEEEIEEEEEPKPKKRKK